MKGHSQIRRVDQLRSSWVGPELHLSPDLCNFYFGRPPWHFESPGISIKSDSLSKSPPNELPFPSKWRQVAWGKLMYVLVVMVPQPL